MSDSSEEDQPYLNFRDDDDSDDEQPRKRRKTTKTLRDRGVGFVSSAQNGSADTEDEEDERPSLGSFRSAFQLGEYTQPEREDGPEEIIDESPPPVKKALPSAFNNASGAKMSFAARQMAKMGWTAGKGLGAKGEGITAPVQAIGTEGRTGLGVRPAAEQPKKRRDNKTTSQASTPGTRTPTIKARPKAKYQTVADIEARGLAVPIALKSIIIDATGSEHRSVSSPAGFMTPTKEASSDSEASKIARRAKQELDMYAKSWDAVLERRAELERQEQDLQKDIKVLEQGVSRLQDLVATLENATTAHITSEAPSEWERVVGKLFEMQMSYADNIDELDLPEAAVATLEVSFKREMAEWDPLTVPDHLVASIQRLRPLLQLERNEAYHRAKPTPFDSLLSQYWFRPVRDAINQEWDVYDPDPVVNLVKSWKPIVPSWLYCKVIDTLVIPKLIAAIQTFGKKSKNTTTNGTAPPLHSWLFDWWFLLAEDHYMASNLAELATYIKPKIDSESWKHWKSLLGERKRAPSRAVPATSTITKPPSPPSEAEDIPFWQIVEEWGIEHDLLLDPLHRPNDEGLPLYRLRPASSSHPGVTIFFKDDVVFDRDYNHYGLDDRLVGRAKSKVAK